MRVHSFDMDPARVAAVAAHPYCVGVWAYPHHARLLPGAHPLPPLFTAVGDLPDPAPRRDLVLSVSAGLPKKDWPTLVEAFARLAEGGAECRVVVGVTYAHEDVPEEVRARFAARGARVPVHADLPRPEVFGLLARTAALVYTLEPGRLFGMPMSVVEGLCAGASVVLPERPEARDHAGPGFRGYRGADDIVAHAHRALAGGPAVGAERRANRRYGRQRFCDPGLAARFHDELVAAVERWRATRP